MTRTRDESGIHGPENAEHELRKAYNCVVESGLTYFWDRTEIAGVDPNEVSTFYKRGYQAFRRGDRLTAERWSRTAKHLARALWHEAKIAWLEPRVAELPYLPDATAEEYSLHEHSDTTADLLDSLATHLPDGISGNERVADVPDRMQHYLSRARWHLQTLESADRQHELLRAERIKAAHEYGRVLECMSLAYEAETAVQKAA